MSKDLNDEEAAIWGSMAKGSLVEGASCAKALRWHVSGMFEEHRGALSVGLSMVGKERSWGRRGRGRGKDDHAGPWVHPGLCFFVEERQKAWKTDILLWSFQDRELGMGSGSRSRREGGGVSR